MKRLIYFFIVLISCNSSQKPAVNNTKDTNTLLPKKLYGDNILLDSNENDDLTLMYLVVADTGYNYYHLMNNAIEYCKNSNYKIDSMGRYFDAKKASIILSLDDPDELYRGQYVMRRYDDVFFSVEYMSYYYSKANPKLMASISGIFVNAIDAEENLNKIKKHFPNAFYFKSIFYTGCIH